MLVIPLAAGCASDRDAIDRRLEGLSEDITRLQATNDRLMQRVDQLEVERASRREAKTPTPAPNHHWRINVRYSRARASASRSRALGAAGAGVSTTR